MIGICQIIDCHASRCALCNLLDFNLKFGDEGKAHRCFKLIDTENLNINLDLIQIHILEVKRFIDIIKNSSKEELVKKRTRRRF